MLDLIYRKQTYLPSKLFRKHLYVNLSNKYLINFISSNKFTTEALNYLKDKEYIMVNDKYSTGQFSKSYKISPKYLGKTIKVEIIDKTINRKITNYKEKMRAVKVKNNEKTKKKYFKEFNLDYDVAITATQDVALKSLKSLCNELKLTVNDSDLKNILELGDEADNKSLFGVKMFLFNNSEFLSIIHRMMNHQMTINAINDGFLYFKRNNTNGRLDSNLSNLPTYLRKFIRSDKNLFNIDIKNSQPLFLYCTLKNSTDLIDTDELEKYKELVEGGILYDFFRDKWNETHKTKKNRSQAKQMIFKIIFSKIDSYQKYKELFRSEFPTIMDWIDYKNSENNSIVANMMTIKESTLIP